MTNGRPSVFPSKLPVHWQLFIRWKGIGSRGCSSIRVLWNTPEKKSPSICTWYESYQAVNTPAELIRECLLFLLQWTLYLSNNQKIALSCISAAIWTPLHASGAGCTLPQRLYPGGSVSPIDTSYSLLTFPSNLYTFRNRPQLVLSHLKIFGVPLRLSMCLHWLSANI